MKGIRKYDVVRVVRLRIENRRFEGTRGISRPPRIGDIGAVVHEYQPEDPKAPVRVENVDANGRTTWLADFQRDEMEFVPGRPVEDSAEFIANCLERLRRTKGPFDVCSPLEGLDAQVLQQYAISEKDEDVRAYLVGIIWEKRRPEAIPFLARMLNDPSKKVWKTALDGLGVLKTDAALAALKNARAGVSSAEREYIDEAIDQLENPDAWP